MRAIRIAEELGISRERVRVILNELGLEANIKGAPTKRYSKIPTSHRSSYRPKPVVIPRPVEIMTGDAIPTVCPKCACTHLIKEASPYGWELKCFACGLIVAFGSLGKETIYTPPKRERKVYKRRNIFL